MSGNTTDRPPAKDNTGTGLDVWIITGLSGAGKTNAIRIFEDWNYFCIDNLPPSFLKEAVAMLKAGDIRKIALGVDVRSGMLFDRLIPTLKELEIQEGKVNVLFLDADGTTLMNRFKETRRRHPMASESMLMDTISAERARLEIVRERADVIIDTSHLLPRNLKEALEHYINTGRQINQFTVHVLSFGYKYGIPMDADLLMDVRFLPNPHYIPELQKLTGLDSPVRDYVMDHEVSQVFFQRFSEMLIYLIPKYMEEGKTNLVVAIGCTGGRHRSVTLSEILCASLVEAGFNAAVRHRDVKRPIASQAADVDETGQTVAN